MRFHKPLFWVAAVLLISSFARGGSVEGSTDVRQIFPNETWYYGYRPTPGDEPDSVVADSYDLVAYQLDGETVIVLEGFQEIPLLFSLATNHALVVGEKNGEQRYFEVEKTEAVPLEIIADNSADTNVFALVSYRAPYVLLSAGASNTRPVIADLEENTVQVADQSALYGIENCCVLTEDGKLQYFALLKDTNTQETLGFALVERDLGSGEEQMLFDEPGLQIGVANRSGNRWLLQTSVPETGERAYVIWEDSAELTRQIVQLPDRLAWVDDTLYRDEVDCEQHCNITLEAPDGEVTTISTAYPDTGEGSDRLFLPYRLLDDGSLLGELRSPNQVVKIDPDGEVIPFGYLNLNGITTNGMGAVSRDGRFVVVTPERDGGAYAVVNTETGETVLENDPDEELSFASVFFFPQGVLVNTYGDTSRYLYYRVSDQQIFEIPVENISYFDVLDDDTLLYFLRSEETTEIGLYQLETGEMQAAVEGLWPLYPRTAIR